MSDNEKKLIAKWAGDTWPTTGYAVASRQDALYTNDSDAVRLLTVLKERGYWFVLGTETDELSMLTGEYRFKIVPPQGKQVNVYAETIAEAISSAILQLIDNET